ncbi:MAG: patatin family protein [Erysipelotrichaceae bacterium]|nr:patatin family protein [Erysipelotrichaceae bacterium]
MKSGLILEGGAMRGMYTAGVMDVMLENGIHFDEIVGVSAGALFGVNYASGQKRRVIRYNKRFNSDSRYMGIVPLIREGNIISEFAFYQVPQKLDIFDDEKFKKSGIRFYAVLTNVDTGLPEYHLIESVYDQMETLKASGAIPLVSKPVVIRGQRYLDGGIGDSIPYEWMHRHGADKLVVVLTRDAAYRKQPFNKAVIALTYGLHSPFGKKMSERYKEYNDQVKKLTQWEKEGKAFVIRPTEPIIIEKLEKDPEKLQEVYEIGVRDAKAKMEELKLYLEQK